MENLAPRIYRQTALVEWLCPDNISAERAAEYLVRLAARLSMTLVKPPITDRAEGLGEAAYAHWVGDAQPLRRHPTPASTNGWGQLKESGVHFYGWDRESGLVPEPYAFGSVEAYTCSPFDILDAVRLTKQFFRAVRIVYQDVSHGDAPAPALWRPARCIR